MNKQINENDKRLIEKELIYQKAEFKIKLFEECLEETGIKNIF
jgi:hypothetical protein